MLQVVELRQQQAERLDMTNFQEKARNATQPRPHRRPHRPSGYPTGPLVPLPLTPCCVPRPPRTPPFLLPLPRDPLPAACCALMQLVTACAWRRARLPLGHSGVL